MILPVTPPAPAPTPASRQVRRARARQRPAAQKQSQTQEIMSQGAARATARATAAALHQAGLTEAEVLAWRQDLQARLKVIQEHPEQHLGHIEEQLAALAKEPLRLAAERAAQAKANATPCQCHQCQGALIDCKYLQRHITSRFGRLTVWRHYGWCARCEAWDFPADHVLGMPSQAPASPYLQEICALLATKMPPEQATEVAQRLGLDLPRCTLDREAHRQGLKAQAMRTDWLAQLDTWESLQQLARQTENPASQPFTLIIEMDAWNIRERDDWGQTETLREQGQKVERWHWVYTGTVFRLDHRTQTQGKRALISQRGYVATRAGLEAFTAQLYREALQRGLLQAELVLVIADGAQWIWNFAQDRFPNARHQLDLWHGSEHLWEVAHDLYGKGTPEANAWVKPLLAQIHADQTPEVIRTLTELHPRLSSCLQEKLQKQIDYFANNAHRMKYQAVMEARKACRQGKPTLEQRRLADQPLGSGAIESTCRQYQCRFKRTGQFWTTAGDEALMCLETLWRNGRWHELYSHVQPPAALN